MSDVYAEIKADARARFLADAQVTPSLLKYQARFQLGIHNAVRAASERQVTDKDLLDVVLRYPEILSMDPEERRGGYTTEDIRGAITDGIVYLIDADLEKDLHPGEFAAYPGAEEVWMEDYNHRVGSADPGPGPRPR